MDAIALTPTQKNNRNIRFTLVGLLNTGYNKAITRYNKAFFRHSSASSSLLSDKIRDRIVGRRPVTWKETANYIATISLLIPNFVDPEKMKDKVTISTEFELRTNGTGRNTKKGFVGMFPDFVNSQLTFSEFLLDNSFYYRHMSW